jgi:hypothetical protein
MAAPSHEAAPASSADPIDSRRRALVRAAKDRAKAVMVRANTVFERAGVHVEPVHYYSNVPDRRALRRTIDEWAKPLPLFGIDWDLDAQAAWVLDTTAIHISEVTGLADYERYGRLLLGPGYGPIESQLLHCVVRSLAPARILEVGSGVSTMVSVAASCRNADEGRPPTDVTCIEPYPGAGLLELEDVRLIRQPAQVVPAEVFEELGAGDVLFVDSTHTVRTGSELSRLYLDVLPRLAHGVLVHIHDIYLPYAFAPDVLDSLFDWQETTLVAALLTGSDRFEVLACCSALHHERPDGLGAAFPDYRPRATASGLYTGADGHFPSSLWLRAR